VLMNLRVHACRDRTQCSYAQAAGRRISFYDFSAKTHKNVEQLSPFIQNYIFGLY
jgi:hypothetical protein